MKYKMLSLVIASLLLASVAVAQPNRPMHKRGGPGHPPIPNLTEEQQATIQDMMLAMRKEVMPLRTKLQGLRSELMLVQTADQFDKSAAEKLVKQMQEIRAQVQMKRIMHHQEVRKLLTAVQRKAFDMHLLSGPGHGFQGMHGQGFGQGWQGRGWRHHEVDDD